MWARVTRRPVPPERLDATLEAYRSAMIPYVISQAGNAGALVLFNKGAGEVLTVSLWNDEASMDASVAKRPKVVDDAAGGAGGEEYYEVFAMKQS